MSTKHEPLCQTKGCPTRLKDFQGDVNDWHRPWCQDIKGHKCWGPLDHQHVPKKKMGGNNPDSKIRACLCRKAHDVIDNSPYWGNAVLDVPGIGKVYRIWQVKDEKTLLERVIEAAPAGVEAARIVAGLPEPTPTVDNQTSLPAVKEEILNLDADYSGLDDDALVTIYEQAGTEMQGAYLIRCKAIDAYRTNHEQAWGKSWVDEARERFGRSGVTLLAQSNFWRLYVQTRCAGAVYLTEEMAQLSEQLGLINLIGRQSKDDRPKYLEAAVTLMAETGDPPTPAHVKNKLKADVRAAQVTGPGKATVYQRDALDFLESLVPESVDLLLTDPPYMTDVEDIATFAQSWVPLALSRIKSSGRAYIFTGAYPRELHAYLSVLLDISAFTFDNILVWTYRNTLGPSPSYGYKLNWQSVFYLYGPDAPPLDCPTLLEQFTVQEAHVDRPQLHAWQKPDDLAERLVQHSTRPNELIADPFVGTGTFLAAALRLGRIGIGSEINRSMLALCRERGLEVRDAD